MERLALQSFRREFSKWRGSFSMRYEYIQHNLRIHAVDLLQWTAVAARPSEREVPSGCHGNALPSVMKPVANLDNDFARIQIVRSAKGEAVVQQNAAICDVDPLNVHGKAFAEALPSERSKVVCGCR
jgi:hypothetical protein